MVALVPPQAQSMVISQTRRWSGSVSEASVMTRQPQQDHPRRFSCRLSSMSASSSRSLAAVSSACSGTTHNGGVGETCGACAISGWLGS